MRKVLGGFLIALTPCFALAAATSESDTPIANAPTVRVEKISGDQNSPGLYILRSHLPAGGLVRPHFHSADRHIVVMSGVLYVCNTGTVSTATTVAHKAGEVVEMPAKAVHCSWAKDGDVEYLELGVGPVTTTFIEK